MWQPTYTDGSGERRKSKFYWVAYRDEAGKRVSENSGFTTKEGARKKLEEIRHAILSGEHTALQRYKDVTLAQIATTSRRSHTKGRRSTKKLELSLKRITEHFGESFPVHRLTTDKIEEYRNARRADESKPSEPTIARELAALKAALRLGYKTDRVSKVPLSRCRTSATALRTASSPRRKSSRPITRLESKDRTAPLAPLVRFLYRTGMRAEEPLGLRWSEVRLDLKTLRLPGRRTKNKDAKPLTLDGDVLKIVKQQRELCDRKFPKCEFVFPDREGDRLRMTARSTNFRPLAQRSA